MEIIYDAYIISLYMQHITYYICHIYATYRVHINIDIIYIAEKKCHI